MMSKVEPFVTANIAKIVESYTRCCNKRRPSWISCNTCGSIHCDIAPNWCGECMILECETCHAKGCDDCVIWCYACNLFFCIACIEEKNPSFILCANEKCQRSVCDNCISIDIYDIRGSIGQLCPRCECIHTDGLYCSCGEGECCYPNW